MDLSYTSELIAVDESIRLLSIHKNEHKSIQASPSNKDHSYKERDKLRKEAFNRFFFWQILP